jgi:hypothetical protein
MRCDTLCKPLGLCGSTAKCVPESGLISVGGKRRKIGWRYALLALVFGLELFTVAKGSRSTTPTTRP